MKTRMPTIQTKMLVTTLISVLLGVASVLAIFIPAMIWRASYVKQLELLNRTRLMAANMQTRAVAAAADAMSLKQSPLVFQLLQPPSISPDATAATVPPALVESLTNLLTNKPQYSKVSITDQTGQELLVIHRDPINNQVQPKAVLSTLWSDPTIQQVLSGPDHMVATAMKNTGTQDSSICFVVGVMDSADNIIGTVTLEANAKNLLVTDAMEPGDSYTVTTDSGEMVYLSETAPDSTWLSSQLPTVLNGSNLSLSQAFKSQSYFVAHSPINLTPDRSNPSKVILVSTFPVAQTLEPILRLTLASGLVLLVALSCIGLFTYQRVSAFLKPLAELVGLSRKIGAGDFSRSATVYSDDELGEVAISFNSMIQRLSSLYSELEKKVADQNLQLEQQLKEVEQKNQHVEQAKNAMLNLAEDLDQEKNQALTQKARVEAILLNIGVGVVVLDKNGRTISANPAACELLGYQESELCAANYVELIQAADESGQPIPAPNRTITLTQQSQTKQSQTMVYTRKDGSAITVFVTDTPITINGNYTGQVLVITDVTQEKAIDRMKTEFISLASHQLRTPLSTVNWYLELVLGGDAGAINDQQRKFIEEAYQGSKRLVTLVRSLLDVSRIELGTFSIEPEPVNISSIATSVIDELKPLIDKKQLEVTTHIDNFSQLMLDPELTRIMIQNLMTNAVKYTPEKKTVQLSITSVSAQNPLPDTDSSATCDSLLISVVDQGVGIPSSQQPDIFKKLFRADNARKIDTEGTGLGLYIIKELLEQMGGQIWFKSQENSGSSFHILLPLEGMRQKTGTKRLGH